MNLKTILYATALTAVASTATAQEVGEFTVGAGLSSFGANIEGAYQVAPQFRARGAFMGGFSYEFEDSDGDAEIKGDFDLGGIAILADYYPLGNGWRVSGGLFYSNTELSADGTVEVEDGMTTRDAEASVSATFENELSPMITTGYDLSFGDGWAFTSEIGVIFNGGINIEFDAENDADQADIDNDQDAQDLISDAGDITALPYLSLGVSYRF